MKVPLIFVVATIAVSPASAGTERYANDASKQPVDSAVATHWYADNEWNVGLWGTYAFTANDYRSFPSLDRYISADHAWGGGIDAKRFFGRYFGLGIEGYVSGANRTVIDREGSFGFFMGGTIRTYKDLRAVGSGLATATFRYPLLNSCFAPYMHIGGGAILGGGDRDKVTIIGGSSGDGYIVTTTQTASAAKAVGQFGAGFEVRLTPRVGLLNDFSWSVVDGPNNNFGMARTGINFAF
jgi:hypothetical protein